MKKILVLPVKNEDWILEASLACASLWADHIIIADQNSTDRSGEIYKKFPKVIMLENPAKFHSSNVRKLLLDAARHFEGNNAIFSFDADEIPTAEILQPEFWKQVQSLQPGSSIELLWVNLWRSVKQYRTDGAQAPVWKHVAFIDDRKAQYTTINVINDHTSRVPLATARNSRRFEQPKILHYQFANWSRTLSKQAHYRMTEWLQKEKSWLNALKINLKYYPTRDERGLAVREVPDNWQAQYRQRGINPQIFESAVSWHDIAALDYFAQYGVDFFSLLDIWDIDWEKKRQAMPGASSGGAAVSKPRLNFVPAVLQLFVSVLSFRNWFGRLYGRLSRKMKT